MYIVFLFLLLNIDCGYSLEVPIEVVLICTHNLCFEQKEEKLKLAVYCIGVLSLYEAGAQF